jgi:serine/threonine-protein kinase
MLYECLSGRKPFAGDTTPTVLYKIVNEAPDPIETEKLRGISPAIRSVLDRALCKNPDERFQTAEDLAKSLRAAKDPSWMGQVEENTTQLRASAPTAQGLPASSAITAQGPASPPAAVPPPRPTPKPGGKAAGPWIGIAALVLAGLGGVSWWLLKERAPAPAAQAEIKSEQVAVEARPTLGTTPGPKGGAIPTQAFDNPPNAREAALSAPPKIEQRPETRPEPVRPSQPKPAELKAIDQPEQFQPEKLNKLEVHERKNLGNVSMSEAIQISESQPDKAIQGFRQAIKADPTNASARAWLAWVLINQGRTSEFVQEVSEGRRLGLLGQMNQNVRFRSAFARARLNQQLPPDLAN